MNMARLLAAALLSLAGVGSAPAAEPFDGNTAWTGDNGVTVDSATTTTSPAWGAGCAAFAAACCVLLCCTHAAAAVQAEYYVSPTGSDAHAGTIDEPFLTIEHARDIVKTVNAGMTGDIVVHLRAGTYRLAAPLALGAGDSGMNGHYVTYQAHAGEAVSISGGRLVTGWTPAGGGVYAADATGPAFRQLFVDGACCVRARTPYGGPGGDPAAASYNRTVGMDNTNRLVNVNSAELAVWSGLAGVELVSLADWNQMRLRAASVDVGLGRFTPQEPERASRWELDDPIPMNGDPYFFENSLDFLDAPGEWYLDRSAGVVYCMPPAGVDLNAVEVVAPSLELLIDIDGAHNVGFRDIVLEHTTWLGPDGAGLVGWQGGVYKAVAGGHPYHGMTMIPSAVHIQNAQACRFDRCTFRLLGAGGLWLKATTDGNVVDTCAFEDIAGCGVTIGDVWFDEGTYDIGRSDPALVPKNDRVTNCKITRVAKDYTGCAGVFATWCEGAVIERNEVSYMPWNGLHVGWGWGSRWNPNPTSLRNNVIRYNHVHHVGQLHSDMAGIYMLGYQTNSLVAENYLHDIRFSAWARNHYGGSLYCDAGSGGNTTLQDNFQENNDNAHWMNRITGPLLGNWWTTDPVKIAEVKANAGPQSPRP